MELIPEDFTNKEVKEVKKRSYESQKANITKYLKNKWENDADFREKETERKKYQQRIKYNDDDEWRLKKLEISKTKRLEKKQSELDDMIIFVEGLIETGNIETNTIRMINKLLKAIKKYRPEYSYKIKTLTLEKTVINN